MTERQEKIASYLEELYSKYNRRELVSPDPLQFLYRYDRVEDREIAALIASSLAYGRVATILKSVAAVLDRMGSSPRDFIENTPPIRRQVLFLGFRHRFTGGGEVAALLDGVQSVIERAGSLGAYLVAERKRCGSLTSALESLIAALECGFRNTLLSPPSRGSACKRHFLMLRWMTRHDDVDPGGWDLDPAELLVPLDTHMYTICRELGFTCRKSADLKTAEEVTAAFRQIRPDDPVRYDFVLTRFGIRDDLRQDDLLRQCHEVLSSGKGKCTE